MPIIFTRGGLSARGAGTFSLIPPVPVPPPPTPGPPPPPPPPGPPPPVTQTVVFGSSNSWTVPAGVFQISDLFIAGGQFTEIPGQFIYTTNIAAVLSPQTSATPGPTVVTGGSTYAYAGNYADGTLAEANRGGTGERDFGYPQLLLFDNPSLSPATRYWQDTNFIPNLRIRGVASRTSGPWDNRSENTFANGTGNAWSIGVDLYYPPETVNGDPSSAFGYTVQGVTSANPDPIQAFGSLSVTPGQTYNINVGGPQGGFVQFEFVQG